MTAAFMPPEREPFETSVAMHDSRTDVEIWADGKAITREGRHLHGRAVADVADAVAAKLAVKRDETPPNLPHHANLVGWASEKEKRLEQAADLAAVSRGETIPSVD